MAAAADPPERVGRLARIDGAVSLRTQDADQWTAAAANYPVTSGNALWTEPNAQAEIEVSDSSVVLAGGTELDTALLDLNGLQAVEPQGRVFLHLRDIAPSESWSVRTPRGVVGLSGNGRYEIAAGDTQTPTLVTVVEGRAHVALPGQELDVGSGETAVIEGTDAFHGYVGPAHQDPFLDAMLARENPQPVAQLPLPPVVQTMPGATELTGYGDWQPSEYGPAWYPRVGPGWVPYREGRWVWVEPWGWTWVDDEPWGFAPFHYGRWAEIGGRWAWLPASVAVVGPPVYAPALVTFFGVGIGAGIGAALATGSVGWCPLGPREPYHPWYHASPGYIRSINIHHVRNVEVINRNVTINNFINHSATTIVPAIAMQASRPVRTVAERADPGTLASAHPFLGRPPVAPAAGTAGVTPAFGRQWHVSPPSGGVPAMARPAVPGPAAPATPPQAPSPAVQAGSRAFPQPQRQVPATAVPAASLPLTPPALRAPGASPALPPAVSVPHGPPAPAGRTSGPAFHHPLAPAAPFASAPSVQAAPSAPQVQHPSVAAVTNVPPPPVHHPAPIPQAHFAAPQAPPQVHAAPPPMPQVHAIAPPPQFHAAPPPPMHAVAPAPQFHAAAAPPPHAPPQQERQKRPGER
ncbi:MAG: FecR domain-containing protein [Acetobacteraceae bacterium]|nr:FecR domain-containing protein [Acetobacteraceae bacterium]